MIKLFGRFAKYSDVALACCIVGVLIVLLFPVNKALLDLLLAFSIATSIVILMTTLFINKPLELSVFPTLLLVTTIIRLSLNIASTRLILSNGHTGTSAAGKVIEAFGHFVMQGNVVIGIIVFMILTIINFIVITKGSGRIAEVAARFSLDSMPGKQMSIDADLSAGLIGESEARARRKTLEDESSFYGAMDGANKFVRGDAIAGLIITFINLIGGIIIGMLQRNLSFDQAIKMYSMLTIGDGLVTQIPALVISLSAGLLVTKSGTLGSADKAIFGQLGQYPKALTMSSVVTGLMALLPGLPFLPFCLLSFATGAISYLIINNQKSSSNNLAATNDQMLARGAVGVKDANAASDAMTDAAPALTIDPVRLELGYNLIGLINAPVGLRIVDQIKNLRQQIARLYGFVVPTVMIRDNLQLADNQYAIKIKDAGSDSGSVYIDKILVLNPGGEILVPGIETKEPTFGLNAKWVDVAYRDEAAFYHYTVVEPSTVIITHLTEVIKNNITELLSYTEVLKLLDNLGDDQKKLMKEIVPDKITVGTIQKVLHSLLIETVSIRDLGSILEGINDGIYSGAKNIVTIVEFVRRRLARQISFANLDSSGSFIPAISLSQEWEKVFDDYIDKENESVLVMPPSKIHEFHVRLKRVYDEQASKGYVPVLLTTSHARPHVSMIVHKFKSFIAVLSYDELYHSVTTKTMGML